MNDAIIAAVTGIISGILAGTITARVSVNRIFRSVRDSQTVANSSDVRRDDNRVNHSTDGRATHGGQWAQSDQGDATNIGGDQVNWRN